MTTLPFNQSDRAIAQGIQTIDCHTLKSWLDRDQVLLVDVREPGEHRGEKIHSSHSFPLSTFDPHQLPTPTPGQTLVFHCQTSNRSHQAAEKYLQAGIGSSVLHLAGGLNDWKAAGLPTQVNAKAPISLMRQVQIVAGSLVVAGTVLGAWVNPGFLVLSGFVGCGLVFAGVTNTCALAMVLAKLPYNR